MVKGGKVENALVTGIAKVLRLFSLKERADRLEREYACLQQMSCTRPLDGIDKELGLVCFRVSTAKEITDNMREDDHEKISVGEQFRLVPLSIIRGIFHVVRSRYSVETF